jgi:hypothetical protein
MRGGVFICYRREDAAGFAGRIYDRLKNGLGRESVFIDVDNIPAGRDFVEVLTERVGRCDALVALIGRNWLASADKNNRRRLDDPNDFVRIEIEAALERNVPVIPVLVDGAVMPQADDLPQPLKKLARRQGIEISHNRFDSDAERLTDALAQIDGGEPGSKRDVANARPPEPTERSESAARWLLALASGLVVIGGAASLLYEQRGAREATARQEEEAKPTSNVIKALPTSEATSNSAPASNAAAPPPDTASNNDLLPLPPENASNAAPLPPAPPDNANNAAAPIPNAAPEERSTETITDRAPAKIGKGDAADASPNNANNVGTPQRSSAPDETKSGKIADGAPARVSKAGAPDVPPATLQWMNIQDFKLAYDVQEDRNYFPDKVWGRCWKGVQQRSVAHWSPRPAGQYIILNHTSEGASGANRGSEKDFKTDVADKAANGFTMKSDSAFQGCDGAKRHLTVWTRAD